MADTYTTTKVETPRTDHRATYTTVERTSGSGLIAGIVIAVLLLVGALFLFGGAADQTTIEGDAPSVVVTPPVDGTAPVDGTVAPSVPAPDATAPAADATAPAADAPAADATAPAADGTEAPTVSQ